MQRLSEQYNSARTKLNHIENSNNVTALAQGDTQDHLAMLAAIDRTVNKINQTSLQQSKDFQLTSEDFARIEHYRGILLWQSTEAFNDNLWQKKNQLNEIEKELESLRQQSVSTQHVFMNAPEIAPLEDRLKHIQPRLNTQTAALRDIIKQQSQQLKTSLIDELLKHQSRLKTYIAYSQLAIARLYDQALDAKNEQENQSQEAAE